VIGSLDDIERLVRRECGTWIEPGIDGLQTNP